MPDVARTGLLIHAKNLQAVSSFQERVLGAGTVHADTTHTVLQSADTKLIIHAIPPQCASEIDIAVPPTAREEPAIEPFFTVAHLAASGRAGRE